MYAFAGHVGFAKETTWGTPVAVGSGDFMEALSENLTLAIERFDVRNIVGRMAEPDDIAGLRRNAGQLVVAANPLQLGHILRGVFTTPVSITVVLSGFLWECTYQPLTSDPANNNALQPYTLEIFRDVTSSHRYAGVQMSKLTLGVQPNQDLRVTVGLLAKTTSVIAKSTPTYPGSPANPFTFDTSCLQLAGAAIDTIETLAIDFDNQVEGIPILNNSNEIGRTRRKGPQMVRVSGTIGFETQVEYNRFVQQSEANLIASWTKTDSFGLVVRVPKLVYTAFPLGMGGRDRLTVGFEGTGRYDGSLGYAIQTKLTTVKSDF